MRADFISGPRGALFIVYYPRSVAADAPGSVAADVPDRGDLIFIPPFAEEMNRARSIIAHQARLFQQAGFGVLVLDLFGTGDSEGDFADARWETWRGDVLAAAAWLHDQGRKRISLWGLRLGGLLAVDVAFDHDNAFETLLLWQPVTSGRRFLDQFLRIGAVTQGTNDDAAVSVSGGRLRLDPSQPIDIMGYTLSRSLAHAIDRTDMSLVGRAVQSPVVWIDRTEPIPRTGTGPPADEILAMWKGHHGPVFHHDCDFPAFWSFESAPRPDALHRLTTDIMATPAGNTAP